jgi:hypothetical protein
MQFFFFGYLIYGYMKTVSLLCSGQIKAVEDRPYTRHELLDNGRAIPISDDPFLPEVKLLHIRNIYLHLGTSTARSNSLPGGIRRKAAR